MDASTLLADHRIVPVVVLVSADAAVPVAEALVDGGIRVAEVTLRNEHALAGVAAISREVPELLIGVGSVRRADQFALAADAGAQFAVSPGTTDALLDAARQAGMPFVPGAATPGEMLQLFEKGYTLQKFFPAGQAGGVGMLRSVAGPIPDVSFMPTGGITIDNAADYLGLENVAAIGGSWLTPMALQRSGDFAAIRDLAAQAMSVAVPT